MYQIELIGSNGNSLIYDQSRMNELSVTGPKCSLETNTSGTLTFTLMPTHPLCNTIEPLSSFVRALDDGTEIFYGRVIRRSHPKLTGQITFECEGAVSFMLDSELPPDPKDSSGQAQPRTMTAQEFFTWCVNQHNQQVDSRRQLTVGTINANRRNESSTFSINSYTQTKNAIESNILSNFGGFVRVRANQNGTNHYIDWIEQYETLNPQAITIGVNVEDQTNDTDGSSVFTVLRPVGADGIELTEKTIDLYSSEDIAKIGRIVKTIQFNDCSTETELRTRANQYKSWTHKTLFNESSINLVDMHYIDGTTPKIRVGDRFNNIAGFEGVEMTAHSLELDFEHPENDTLSLKDKKSLMPDMSFDGHGHTDKKFSRARGASKGAVGLGLKYIREDMDRVTIDVKNLDIRANDLNINVQNLARETAGEFQQLVLWKTDVEGIIHEHTEKFNDIDYEIQDINATAVIQNSQFITDITGKFELWTNPTTGVESLHLKNGAELAVDRQNGTTIIVGEQIATQGQTLEDLGSMVNTMQGSALWTQRDNITGVVGEFDVVYYEVEDPENPGHYIMEKKLVVKSGGGMRVREDNVEYGLFMTPEGEDSAVLTGGLMVQKINNESNTKILGNKVDITASQMASIGIYTEGHYDAGFIVNRINNSTNATITADHIKLDGNVDLNSVIKVGSGSSLMQRPSYWVSNGSYGTSVRYDGISTGQISVNDIYIGTTSGGSAYQLNWANMMGMIKTASVDASTNTLVLTKWSGEVINFRKASSASSVYLDAGWSGEGKLTVRARSSSDDAVVASLIRNLTTGAKQNQDGTTYTGGSEFYIPIRANMEGSSTFEQTGLRARVGLQALSITENGTQTFTPSGINVGWYRVTVNVTPPAPTISGITSTGSTDPSIASSEISDLGTITPSVNPNWYIVTATNGTTSKSYKVKVNSSTVIDTVSLTNPVFDVTGNSNVTDANHFYYTTSGKTTESRVDRYIAMTQQDSWSSNKKYVYVKCGASDPATNATIIGKMQVDATVLVTSATNAGKAAVGLADPVADSRSSLNATRTFTVSTTGRTNASGTADNLSKDVPLHLYNAGFSGNTATVYLKWGASTGSSGTNYASISVDASSLVTSATNAGKAAVGLADPVADSRSSLNATRTFTVSTTGRTNASGTADNLSKDVPLHLYNAGFSGNTATVYLKWGASTGSSGTNYASISVDATSVYNSGWTGAYNTVGLDSTTAKTLNYEESVTVYAQAKASSGASSKTNVASRKITAPADRYGTAWSAAYNKVAMPASGTSANMVVKTPAYTTDQQTSTTYTLSIDYNYAYIKQGSTTVARITNNFKYTQAEYDAMYETAWNAGWNANYSDSPDWIQRWSEGGNTYSVWVPRKTTSFDYYNSPYGRGKGNGSASTCEEWFRYTEGSGGGSSYSYTSRGRFYISSKVAGPNGYTYTMSVTTRDDLGDAGSTTPTFYTRN